MSATARSIKRRTRSLFAEGPLNPVLDAIWAIKRRPETRHLQSVGRPRAADALVLAGSGRSGTTWLAETICEVPDVRQVFEPLYPRWVRSARALPGQVRGPWPNAYGVRLAPGEDHGAWRPFLERALTGRVRGYWTDRLDSTRKPTRFLVKLIRANMMLGYLIDEFSPRVLFVQRHPCATVASRLARGWHAEPAALLEQEAIRDGILSPWIDTVAAESDPLARHAIWWAVENALALEDLATRPHLALTFEDLLMRPHEEVARVFSFLELPLPSSVQAALDRPSSLSRQERSYASASARLNAWKNDLDSEQQRVIIGWAERLGISRYDDAAFPRQNG